ncbi:MAG: conjugal transfer protein TraG [Pedobacter sp.]|nr:MAG: conjugal transfer protein TraG [Pedobacter sp.]
MSKKKVFKLPYIGIGTHADYDLLYGQNGEFSVIVKMENPVLRYSGSSEAYDECHHLLLNLIKILGEGYVLQKQDVFSMSEYPYKEAGSYLQRKYNDHFQGRKMVQLDTFLVIIRKVKKGAFYVYDPKVLQDFFRDLAKILAVLHASGTNPEVLRKKGIDNHIKRVLAMDFSSSGISLQNFSALDTHLGLGDRKVCSINLIDTDSIDLPSEINTHGELNESDTVRGFPVDLLSFLWKTPGFETVVYNQVIEIPSQSMTLSKLNLKKKRHSGIPDAGNLICVEEIDQLLKDVARDNQLLVNAHFNIVVCAKNDKLSSATNFIESELFKLGITPGKNAYNQMELYRSAMPGNATELKAYDWFLTTCDAALCLLFKESQPKDEPSDFLVRFTDREGIPVGIDLSDLPMRTGRISARNRFVLGPSGTGKSYCMNAILEQYLLYNMDVVVVDTGHSYSGLCSYYQGKYITWADEKPITMNPFVITEQEYNIEKKDFLCTLICLLWKGSEGSVSAVERDLISGLISAYYGRYFNPKFPGLSAKRIKLIRKNVFESMKADPIMESYSLEDWENFAGILLEDEFDEADEALIHNGENPFRTAFDQRLQKAINQELLAETRRFERLRIKELNFNTFYEFALERIPQVKAEDQIPFDLEEFGFVLKKFYRGGEYESILNEAADESLFTAPFIVFEIDNLKNNKVLFPIVTLVIMDVFIQKMRFRQNRRKCLVVEEAWKAIASPLMADYLIFLYKTVRKFYGEVIVVTQELSDIIGNAVVKDSIINNSDTTILLDQSKLKDNYKDIIAPLLSISETEQKKIFTINQLQNKNNRRRFSEFYMRRGATGEVYGNEVSLHQHLVYSTEKPEKSAVEVYVKAYGCYTDGLDAYVKDLGESGLSEQAFYHKINQLGYPLTKTNQS